MSHIFSSTIYYKKQKIFGGLPFMFIFFLIRIYLLNKLVTPPFDGKLNTDSVAEFNKKSKYAKVYIACVKNQK